MVANSKSTPPPDAPRREIRISRLIDAPRALVFEAWTDPKHLARWWGPKGFSNPVCEVDARPGGSLHIVMRAVNGTDYPMTAVFQEVVKPERLVFLSTARDLDGKPVLESLTTATFEDQNGKTKLTVHASAVGLAPVAAHYLQGMEAGWTQSLERLADRTGSTAGREITISRVYDFPRTLVYAAFSDPKHLIQWWGPNGFKNTFHSFELKPGGVWRFMMHGPDGTDWPNLIVYHEIVPNERLVYSHGSDDDPEHFQVTVTFVDLGGKTELTMRSVFPSVEACEAVKKFGAVEGGKQTLNKLGEHLAKMQG